MNDIDNQVFIHLKRRWRRWRRRDVSIDWKWQKSSNCGQELLMTLSDVSMLPKMNWLLLVLRQIWMRKNHFFTLATMNKQGRFYVSQSKTQVFFTLIVLHCCEAFFKLPNALFGVSIDCERRFPPYVFFWWNLCSLNLVRPSCTAKHLFLEKSLVLHFLEEHF